MLAWLPSPLREGAGGGGNQIRAEYVSHPTLTPPRQGEGNLVEFVARALATQDYVVLTPSSARPVGEVAGLAGPPAGALNSSTPSFRGANRYIIRSRT